MSSHTCEQSKSEPQININRTTITTISISKHSHLSVLLDICIVNVSVPKQPSYVGREHNRMGNTFNKPFRHQTPFQTRLNI